MSVMKVLVIDNYDSFTWNLVQCMSTIAPSETIEVVRNDRISVEEAKALSPSYLVISPGPCTPSETGVCPELIKAFASYIIRVETDRAFREIILDIITVRFLDESPGHAAFQELISRRETLRCSASLSSVESKIL